MTSKARRSKYKGVKWISTKYAKPYKVRRAIRLMNSFVIARNGLVKLIAIRSTPANTGEEKISKALSIASAVLETQIAISKLDWDDMALNRAAFEFGIRNPDFDFSGEEKVIVTL